MSRPEVWLRGPLPDVPPLLQPVAHSLLQCREEVEAVVPSLTPAELRARPAGAASVEYHVRHAAGSLDRLLTYARGEQLSDAQRDALAAESAPASPGAEATEVATFFTTAVDSALAQVRHTPESALLQPREVGRGRLPSTVLGLLFHAAEHTQRHIGQMVTTAKIVRAGTAVASMLVLGACTPTGIRTPTAAAPAPGGVQAISLLGQPLREFPMSAETRARYERDLAAARRAYDNAPNAADSIVWFGRRLGYLGLVREAIAVYTRGIALHRMNPWLYRHRGHRYITVREFDNALADFQVASRLIERIPDQVEADGQPNARNTPIGTLHSNIRYHLGLTHYLRGEFAEAIPVYEREMAAATNDDRRVSTAHWLYMSLRRLGRDDEAVRVLEGIRRDMDIVENDAYHRLLLMYKGELPIDSVLAVDASGEMSVADATAAYGIGNWHLYNGRADEARRIFQRILAGGQWGAFGYIAAEADLARMQRRESTTPCPPNDLHLIRETPCSH